MKTTEGPMKTTEGPMKTTEGPMKTTEGPMKTTEGPRKITEGPMKTTEGPMKTSRVKPAKHTATGRQATRPQKVVGGWVKHEAFANRAPVGNVSLQRVLRRLLYFLAKHLFGTVYVHWVRGRLDPADLPSRVATDCAGDRILALRRTRERAVDLWASPKGNTVFLWTVGVPIGPFVQLEAWCCRLWSPALTAGDKFHDLFLDYRLSTSTSILHLLWVRGGGVGWSTRMLQQNLGSLGALVAAAAQ